MIWIRGQRPSAPRLCGRIILALGALPCVAAGGGCAAIPLATLGTIGGVTASAVSTGHDVYKSGKLDSAEMGTYGEILAAALAAGTDLDLRLLQNRLRNDGYAEIIVTDERGAQATIKLDRRTARLTVIRIDVGPFGSEVAARLILERLRANLPTTRPSQTGADLR